MLRKEINETSCVVICKDCHKQLYLRTRLSFEVLSLESPWTLDYVLAPLPPLGIGLSVAVREGVGRGHSSALGKPMY